LKYGKFTDKDGLERNTTDIVATELQLLGGREDSQQQAPQRPARPAPPRQAPKGSQGSGFDDLDEIPF